MARPVRDAQIGSRTARTKLAPRREPYWCRIALGRYLGYRRNKSDGTWIARLRDDDGGQRYHRIGTADDGLDADGVVALSFDQAQAQAREWFSTAASMEKLGRPTGPYTVADCLRDYLAWAEHHRKSARHMRASAEAFILPHLGDLDTAKLSAPALRQWHQDLAREPPRLRSRGAAPRYRAEDPDAVEALRKRRLRANRQLVLLRAALTHAWKDDLIKSNGAWTRVRTFAGVERPRTLFLDTTEAIGLLAACDCALKNLVHLALLTGARYGELCALTVADFLPGAGCLVIHTSKSGRGRHVHLTAEALQLCRLLSLGRRGDEPLLRKDDGGGWGRDHHHRQFREAVTRARLDPAFTFHGLRHTWASLAVMNGVPTAVVAQQLGHRDTRMVERHYGHLASSYVKDMVASHGPSFGPHAAPTHSSPPADAAVSAMLA